MAIYYPSGCDELVPAHLCDPCEDTEKARVSGVAYIKTSIDFADPSDPTEWQTAINNKDIIIIPQVLGSFDGGAEVEAPGYGRQATKVTGYNFSLNFKDPNYKLNGPFYNAIKNSRQYKIGFVTETQGHLSVNPVSVIPKNPITESLTDDVVWDVTNKWQDSDLVQPFDLPPGIFDECFEVVP